MAPPPLPPSTQFGRIRAAHPSDGESLLQMVAGLASHHGDTSTLDAQALTRDAFSTPPWIHVLVAEGATGLIGYAALCPLYKLQYGQRGMDLHHLFVEADHRSAAVGRSLVAAAVSTSRDLDCHYLAVGTDRDNLAAQQFYEAIGFQRREADPPRFHLTITGALP